MKAERQKAYKHGVWAEGAAASYLGLKGYKILKTRYKTPVGEIDLVALKGDTLVMVEVKARAEIDEALYAVNTRTQKRVEDATRHFLSENPDFAAYGIRFDVIVLGRNFSLKHLDNAWEARS